MSLTKKQIEEKVDAMLGLAPAKKINESAQTKTDAQKKYPEAMKKARAKRVQEAVSLGPTVAEAYGLDEKSKNECQFNLFEDTEEFEGEVYDSGVRSVNEETEDGDGDGEEEEDNDGEDDDDSGEQPANNNSPPKNDEENSIEQPKPDNNSESANEVTNEEDIRSLVENLLEDDQESNRRLDESAFMNGSYVQFRLNASKGFIQPAREHPGRDWEFVFDSEDEVPEEAEDINPRSVFEVVSYNTGSGWVKLKLRTDDKDIPISKGTTFWAQEYDLLSYGKKVAGMMSNGKYQAARKRIDSNVPVKFKDMDKVIDDDVEAFPPMQVD